MGFVLYFVAEKTHLTYFAFSFTRYSVFSKIRYCRLLRLEGKYTADFDQGETVSKKTRKSSGITPTGFVIRLIGAITVVFGTFNPSGSSYVHWLKAGNTENLPVKVLIGLLLLVGWIICFRATSRSLGRTGVFLAVAVLGVVLWLLIDSQWLSTSPKVLTYAILLIISSVLTLGMTGSYLWRRLTGQYHVSDDHDHEDMED